MFSLRNKSALLLLLGSSLQYLELTPWFLVESKAVQVQLVSASQFHWKKKTIAHWSIKQTNSGTERKKINIHQIYQRQFFVLFLKQ